MIKQGDQLWFMTHIREEEAGPAVIKKTNWTKYW